MAEGRMTLSHRHIDRSFQCTSPMALIRKVSVVWTKGYILFWNGKSPHVHLHMQPKRNIDIGVHDVLQHPWPSRIALGRIGGAFRSKRDRSLDAENVQFLAVFTSPWRMNGCRFQTTFAPYVDPDPDLNLKGRTVQEYVEFWRGV